MDKLLKVHEFSSYLIPGAVALYGFLYLFPSGTTFISTTNVTIGDLGIFTILAYSVGHIVQVLGRYIEKCIERYKGDFKDKEKFTGLVTPDQKKHILKKLKEEKMITNTFAEINEKDWKNLFRQIYLQVVNTKKNERIQVFKNHGKVCRGLGTALVVLLPMFLLLGKIDFTHLWIAIFSSLLWILSILALFDRMRGFDKRDAQETYMQFIEK